MSSSSASPLSLFLTTSSMPPRRSSNLSSFTSPTSFLCIPRSTNPRILSLSSSFTDANLDLSWFPPDPNSIPDNDGGWAVVEAPQRKKNKGLSTMVIGGIGSSVAIVLATVAYFSLYRRGFNFQFRGPLHSLHGVLSWNETIVDSKATDSSDIGKEVKLSDASPECESVASNESVGSASAGKLERIVVPVAADSTQEEALSVLKKLKIIEEDVRSDELCTRREYIRWLVHINLLLERNLKHQVDPSVALSASVVPAFDDVGIEDPDFKYIQALAEAGIIPSKLSGTRPAEVYFFPDSFLTRHDLINWKALVEYEFKPGIVDQISRTKVEYMDMKNICPESSPGLFMDMLAGERSILRKVFGQSKRLQPNKPSMKAQAAVALTSGRISEAIYNELTRLESENVSRQAEMEEMRSELLDRGEIQRFWHEKLNEGRNHGVEVEKHYLSAINELEQEKTVQEKYFADSLKEKAVMDCQKQLLFSLKEEINDLSERLASERRIYVTEQCKLQDMLSDLQSRQEGMLDTKSMLKAEIEALRTLRSWVEDEARKSQARAKVLEELGKRWRWDDQASLPSTSETEK
ncbi:hypothetical protein SLE2022_096170 [Rubroshorea leprosula]